MINAPYMPKKHKRPADWVRPDLDHEIWADELTYGPRFPWGRVLWTVAVGLVLAAIALMAHVGLG
jgi:hypothetical protein